MADNSTNAPETNTANSEATNANEKVVPASKAPIVSWTETDGTTKVSKWQMGKVNAGESSAEKTFLIWNNCGGTEDVSDMQDVQITTTDGVGDTLDVVMDKWIQARCNSAGDTAFTAIGGSDMYMLKAKDQEAGIIKGTKNGGMLTDTANYASVTLYGHPPLNVPAGKRSFMTRVLFYFT